MKQNIYDNPEFFKGYMDLRTNERGLNVAVEEPAMQTILPLLEGLSVLDLGCGFGKFASYCLERGVTRFVGVDISQKMIEEANYRHNDPRASFRVTAIEDFNDQDCSYDLVVSSMCFHYVKDIVPIFAKAAAALKVAGRLVFSVEHPICTSLLKGWYESDGNPKAHWPVDEYRNESVRHSSWFVDGVVKYHRTTESYVNALLDAGLSIFRLLEPGPTATALAENSEYSEHLRRPPILVIAADKKPNQAIEQTVEHGGCSPER